MWSQLTLVPANVNIIVILSPYSTVISSEYIAIFLSNE